MLSCSNEFGDLNQIIPLCGLVSLKLCMVKAGLLGKSVKSPFPSIWLDIIRDFANLNIQGIDLLGLLKKDW